MGWRLAVNSFTGSEDTPSLSRAGLLSKQIQSPRPGDLLRSHCHGTTASVRTFLNLLTSSSI